MKNGTFLAVVIVIFIGGAGLLLASNNNSEPGKDGLPTSLDKYYKNTQPQPPEYLIKMFELGESMQGIGVNIQQGDIPNAKKSYAAFYQNYKNSANMVPEWKEYYDVNAVEKMGASLDNGNIQAVFESMGQIGASCVKCHTEKMTPVWNKYNWMDFSKITMDTPNPSEPKLPWAQAKLKYMVIGFDGIGVNIKNGNQSGAKQSFVLFSAMFDSMNATCASCHPSPPGHYVGAEVRAMINKMGEEINVGNLSEAEGIRQGIGMESCYRCHVLHMPAQFARAR